MFRQAQKGKKEKWEEGTGPSRKDTSIMNVSWGHRTGGSCE